MLPVLERSQSNDQPRAQAALAFALASAFALALASGLPGLADTDPYSHLEYTRLLWASGLKLRGHPFLPFTILGDSGVDLWLGFHWLLLPFAPLGVLWGARVAGACIAGTVAASIAWTLGRLGLRRSWAFGVAPLFLAVNFAFRGHVARPAHLTTPILLLQLFCGAGEFAPGLAAAGAFAHGLLHLSSPLSPLFALLGWGGARLAGRPGSPRAVLWAVGGVGLSLVLRPDRALYTVFAALTNLYALGFIGPGRLPFTGVELFPLSLSGFAWDTSLGFALVALAFFLGRSRARSGSRAAQIAALLAVAVCTALTARGGRFLDYLVPLQAVLAGLLWPRELSTKLRRALPAVLCACAIGLGGLRLEELWSKAGALADPPATLARIAEQVRSRVPPGAMIFTDSPFTTEVLWSSLPEYRFIVAYDPALLYLASPERYWRWYHAVAQGANCGALHCANPDVGPGAAARALRSFDASWAITSEPRGGVGLQETLGSAPDRFELIDFVPGADNGLYLWRLK